MSSQKNKINSPLVIIFGIALLAACLAVFFCTKHISSENERKNISISFARLNYTVGKLEFCLNNSIVPCENNKITDWNASHPDKTFTIKSEKDLTNQGIDDYNTSRK